MHFSLSFLVNPSRSLGPIRSRFRTQPLLTVVWGVVAKILWLFIECIQCILYVVDYNYPVRKLCLLHSSINGRSMAMVVDVWHF